MKVSMPRSEAIEHLHLHLGPYECEWEEGEPEPEKFVDMDNGRLLTAFCSSGVFSQVFAGEDVGEDDLSIVDD